MKMGCIEYIFIIFGHNACSILKISTQSQLFNVFYFHSKWAALTVLIPSLVLKNIFPLK